MRQQTSIIWAFSICDFTISVCLSLEQIGSDRGVVLPTQVGQRDRGSADHTTLRRPHGCWLRPGQPPSGLRDLGPGWRPDGAMVPRTCGRASRSARRAAERDVWCVPLVRFNPAWIPDDLRPAARILAPRHRWVRSPGSGTRGFPAGNKHGSHLGSAIVTGLRCGMLPSFKGWTAVPTTPVSSRPAGRPEPTDGKANNALDRCRHIGHLPATGQDGLRCGGHQERLPSRDLIAGA
jgi:hypothetical protein